MKYLAVLSFLITGLLSANAFAFSPFVVEKIELQGLQRIAPSTVLNYLPVKEGESLDEQSAANAVRALFKTGFFNNVEVARTNNTLVLILEERPSIAKITIEGNDEINTEDLTSVLKKIGLAEGRVFNRSLLDQIEQELQRQYLALGKYGVGIESKVLPQERNRVAIDLIIDEGEVARIRDINIIGNKYYDDKTLLKVFNSGAHGPFSGISGDSKYSREKLQADLELLRSYYMDRGYVNFNLDSTQVTITPDKKDVFITVNVNEGERFTIKEVSLAGELIVEEKELRDLLLINTGDLFSRKSITETSTRISERLSEEGYAFANVNPSPEFSTDGTHEVSVVFYVDPGKRVYIRRVEFVGNVKTNDEVLRREMRQLEGGWYSTTKLNRSQVRLQRTGFFEEVNIDTTNVPGHTDLVDVVYRVTERPSGNVQASLGYGQGSGAIIAGSINQNNFLGTGKRVSLEVNNSQVTRVYSFSMSDPYYTIDGVSRSFSVFSRRTNADAVSSVGAYTTDTYGGNLSFGFPLSEYRSARLGVGFDNTYLKLDSSSPTKYRQFADRYGHTFDAITLNGAWTYDTRNRILFADSGTYLSLSSDITTPGSDLLFAKGNYRHQLYIPVIRDISIHFEANLSYAKPYSDSQIPFYEYYYAGGGQSVRGFDERSLGPKDGITGLVLGGNKRITGVAELIFPIPMAEESRNVRLSAFIDAGNVWGPGEAVDVTSMRAAYGAGFIWITPMGALRFSWAWPLRSFEGDELQFFQFSIGAPF